MADSLEFDGGLEVEQKTITWKIRNFDAIRMFKDLISAQTIEFFAGATIGLPTKWEFHLHLPEFNFRSAGGSDAKIGWIGVYCRPLSRPANAKNVCIGMSMKITSKPNNQRFSQYFKNFGVEPSSGWGYTRVVKQDAKTEDLPLNDEGALILQIDFKVYADKVPHLDIQEIQDFEVESMKMLSQDLNGSSDGTVLVSRDGVEFLSNRGVLSARSPVFRQMFLAKMKESITGRVEIDDLSSKTLAILNTYMLTGKLDADWKSDEIIEELLYGIHKYQLNHLIDWMDKILGKICTKETAKGLAVFAGKFGMRKAERDLVEYLRKYAERAEEITVISIQSSVERDELKRKEEMLKIKEEELKKREAELKEKEEGPLKKKIKR